MWNSAYGLLMAILILYGAVAQVFVNFTEPNAYFLVTGMLTTWLIIDASERNVNVTRLAAWTFSSLLFAPLVVARWYANRPLMQGEIRKGGADANFYNAFGIITLMFTGVSAALNFIDLGSNRGFEIIINSGFAVAGTAFVMALSARKESITETGRPLAAEAITKRTDENK